MDLEMQSNMSATSLVDKTLSSVNKFASWHEKFGDYSYDRMDFFSSKPGILTKRLFYKNKLLGAPFAAFALAQETLVPSLLKLYAKPRREAIGDGHFAKGYLNLYELNGDKKYLEKAETYLQALKESSCTGYSGNCWGYTFTWETAAGLWPMGTPLITITPYPFWAFKKHYELTGVKDSLEICRSTAEFALNDLKSYEAPNGTTCSSYSPLDDRWIANANTYRAALLLDAYSLFKDEKYKLAAEKNIEFVLSYQGSEGEWDYEVVGDKDRFIDNFHTCFVLRNLYYAYKVNKDPKLLEAIKKGYDYYRKELFREDNTPIHFSKIQYNKLRKYEMYDYAEGIKLGALLKDEFDGAFEFSEILVNDLIERFQLKKGHFATRVTSFGNVHKVPYLRWPQAQLFCSLTEYLLVKKN